MSEASRDYVPALGQNWLTPLYDLTIALTTRERHWRKLLLKAADPQPDDTILDIGCGTASFAILLKRTSPQARVIGLDPDSEVLVIAKRKASEASADIEFLRLWVMRRLKPWNRRASPKSPLALCSIKSL